MARGAMAAARTSTRPARTRSSRQAPKPAPRRMSGPRATGVAIAGAAATLPARGAAVLRSPAGRTARSGGGRVLDALLSGRGWIALIFVLLAGIVFFNVDLLRMNREIAVNTEMSNELKRENSQLRLELARLGSSDRVRLAAAELGFVLPAPGEVRYLKGRPGDALRAARRIGMPQPVVLAPVAVEEPLVGETVTDPAAEDPAALDPAAQTAPAETAPATGTPAPTETVPPAAPPPAGTTGAPSAPSG